jgi:predicted dienelactone hydrolase
LSAGAQEPSRSDSTDRDGSASSSVEFLDLDWVDSARDRHVLARIYYPATGSQPLPVIIMSHGLGGSRVGYSYLGRYWADRGYVVVHVQHKGSDTAVWQSAGSPMIAMREAAQDIQNAIVRPRDVSFAIDRLAELSQTEGPLLARLDRRRIGVAGHSMGAQTALLLAGQVLVTPDGQELTFFDSRVKAVVAMSPPVRRSNEQSEAFDKIYGAIRVPCLHFTGTRDESPVGLTAAKDRRVPFDHIHLADQYLVIFQDADHMVFADRRRSRHTHNVEAIHDLVCQSTTAFWNAYLRDDVQAATWLADGGLKNALETTGTLEVKGK